MTYRVFISKKAIKFVNSLPEKSQRIIKEKLKILHSDPYPSGRGDKEKLKLNLPGYELYRMHVARSFTIFYRIQGSKVKILDIMTIEQAHKKYGRL